MLLLMVSARIDDLCCSLPADGVVEFVLYHGVEVLGGRRIPVIVDTAFGKDVGNLLPDAAFTSPDRTDAFQQLAKVVLAKGGFFLALAGHHPWQSPLSYILSAHW